MVLYPGLSQTPYNPDNDVLLPRFNRRSQEPIGIWRLFCRDKRRGTAERMGVARSSPRS